MTDDQRDFVHASLERYVGEGRFGHREHLELCVVAIRRFGADAALPVVAAFIRHFSEAHGAAQKYHETLTRFWTAATAHALALTKADDVDALVAAHPQLLDRGLAERHWSREVLFSDAARAAWLAPDVRPLHFAA